MQNAATSKPKKKGLKSPIAGTDPIAAGPDEPDDLHYSRRSVRHRSGNRRYPERSVPSAGLSDPVNPWRALTLILDGLTSSGMIIGLLLAAGGYTGVVLSTKAIDETVDYAIYKLQDKGINVLVPGGILYLLLHRRIRLR